MTGTQEAAEERTALATRKPGFGLMASFLGVHLITNIANGGVANYLIPLHVNLIDPANKVAYLGMVSTAAAVLGIVAQPTWGMLSDRTRTSWGRRTPWLLGGILGLSACFFGLSTAASIAPLIILGAAIQAFYSMTAAPLAAIVPDRTPIESRAVFSALGGIGVFLGAIAGIFIASSFADDVAGGYRLLGAAVLVGAAPLAWPLRRDSRALPRPHRAGIRKTLATFWINPRRYPDFAWAFLARLVLVTGFWSINTFLLYLLQDYVGLSRDRAAAIYPQISAAMMGALLITIVPASIYSDRTGRRKVVVIVASLIIAASVIIPLVSPTLPAVLASLVIAGAATGAYMSVDQAIMTLVLPRASDAGKDLGILNIAQAGGQLLAPAIASVVIGAAGYQGLYIFAGFMGLVGAAAILPIASVR